MKRTLEDKAKFFAQYWGQNVGVPKIQKSTLLAKSKGHLFISATNEPFEDVMDCSSHLILTPLSSITDEDAIEVAKLKGWNDLVDKQGNIDQAKKFCIDLNYTNGSYMVSLGRVLFVIDFLRKNGYALPFDGISVEEQIELGWIKLKTK